MQMNHLCGIKFASYIVVLCFLSWVPILATHGMEPNLPSSFKQARSEEQRLRACVAAINQRLIYVGMRVRDLDEFLGSEFGKETFSTDAEERISTYKFGKREFAWRFVVQFNRKGEVTGYYLNNLTQKGYSSSEPPKVSVSSIASRFQRALKPSQKLAIAIRAIDSRVISKSSKTVTLAAIFGESTEEKEVKPGWFVTSYRFGKEENSWRLITSGSSEHIYEYYLTNFYCEPWGVKHWGI